MRASLIGLTLLMLVMLAPAQVRAGAAPAGPPLQTWRPFPELPNVLYYEDFESSDPTASAGRLDKAPDVENSKAYKFGEINISNLNKQGNVANMVFAQTPAKFPGNVSPGTITLDFSVWSADIGDLNLTMKGNESYGFNVSIKTAKKWVPYSVKLTSFQKLATHPEEVITSMQMLFVPLVAKGAVDIYIDDVAVYTGAQKSADVMASIKKGRKAVLDAERTWAKDGFTFTLQTPPAPSAGAAPATPATSAASAPKRKGKTVLVFAPVPGDATVLLKALSDTAQKEKLIGFTFVGAEAPDNSPVGGLTDMRTLLRSNVEKSNAQYVLLMAGYKDAQDLGQAPESTRMVMERTLKLGCTPVLSVPPLLPVFGEPGKSNLQRFADAVGKAAAQKGVSVIEASCKFKLGEVAIKSGELNEAGLKSLAAVAVSALKQIDANLARKR